MVAQDVALDLVRALRPVVAQLRRYRSEAANPVGRTISSVVLAEGDRRHGRDARRFWDIAHDSAGRSAVHSIWQMRRMPGWQVGSTQPRVLLDRELGPAGGS